MKFLVILLLVGYLLFKFGGYIFRFIYLIAGGKPSHRNTYQHNHQNTGKKPPGANVDIDYVPSGKDRNKERFEGGEYVDYEEVK